MLARASQPEWPCARSPCTPSSTFRGLVFTTMLLLVSDRHHNHQNGSSHHSDHQSERQSSSEWQLSSSWSSVRAANIFRATIIIRVTVVILMIIRQATWPSPGGCPWSCWWPRCWPSWRSQARAQTEQQTNSGIHCSVSSSQIICHECKFEKMHLGIFSYVRQRQEQDSPEPRGRTWLHWDKPLGRRASNPSQECSEGMTVKEKMVAIQ